MKLIEFIKQELNQGKTVGQIKKDIKHSKSGWSSAEISKAIHLALKKEEPAVEKNQAWLIAVTAAIVAIIVISAVIIYLVG